MQHTHAQEAVELAWYGVGVGVGVVGPGARVRVRVRVRVRGDRTRCGRLGGSAARAPHYHRAATPDR
eukprot:scaffold128969_cov54-Phaeocystis_antarctica.AAC.5